MLVKPTLFLVILLGLCAALTLAQDESNTWQRVIPGPGFNIDVSVESLKLEANRNFAAKFKTTLSESEPIDEKSKKKHKTRIETNHKILLLWDGVFLELVRPDGNWGASLLKLITN